MKSRINPTHPVIHATYNVERCDNANEHRGERRRIIGNGTANRGIIECIVFSVALWSLTLKICTKYASLVWKKSRNISKKRPNIIINRCSGCVQEFTLPETLTFNTNVQWTIITNDPFISPTHMSELQRSSEFK